MKNKPILFRVAGCVMLVLILTGITPRVLAQDTTRLSLLFAGDIMGHGSQIQSAYDAKQKKHDYTSCFQYMKPYMGVADVAIGNLELTLAGPPYTGYPQFSSPDALLVALKDMGFDILVTSNNHCVDRGSKGLIRTIRMLDSLQVPHTGTFMDSTDYKRNHPLIFAKHGFTVALLNYTFSTNGLPVTKPTIVNRIDTVQMGRDLRRARAAKPDVIIVFTHWGVEYERLPNAAQKAVTEFCFRQGVQLVIGAHPHVIQPMEWRKGKQQFVAYSLGNFVSGQRKRYTDGGSMAYVALEKIIYKPDSAVTTIDTAGYYLQYVHRTVDADKDYYMMPVTATEKNPAAYIKDAASRQAFQVFADDSRKLYQTHNINVPERTIIPEDSVITYTVVMYETARPTGSWTVMPSQSAYPWGLAPVDLADKVLWMSGKFEQAAAAERYRRRYLQQHPQARVVKLVNGKLP